MINNFIILCFLHQLLNTLVYICISAVQYRCRPLGCDSKFINSSNALFLMAKKKFGIFRGEGLAFFVPLENPA